MSDTSFVGDDLYVVFGSTELAADYRRLSPRESVNNADGTSGSDSYVRELPTTTTFEATLEMVGPAGGTAAWAALAPKTEGTLEWGEEGTATGKPRHYVTAYIKGREQAIVYNEVVLWTITFGPRGDVTHTVY